MSPTWHFGFLVPHAAFQDAVENDYLALVPHDDPRLTALSRQYSAVARLVEHITDQFGRKISPSALLVRADAPDSVDFYAVASFRNLIAISSVIDAWSFQLTGGSCGYPMWSDYFDFYAFTATKAGDELIATSVASMELDTPGKFVGQRAAHLPGTGCMSFGTDQHVLDLCLKQWERRFVQNRKEWKTRVLFRSLEIACQACRMPAVGTRSPTIHDVGVGISLWVSAFEILKERRTDHSSLRSVLQLLSQAQWVDPALKAKRYVVKNRNGKTVRVDYPSKLYAELYRARCDFLHGNPVTAGNLFPSKDRQKPILLHCAPLIYRAAIASFVPSTADLSSFFGYLLKPYEGALKACQDGTAPNPRRRGVRKGVKP